MPRKKKKPKPKLFGPDIFGWGGGLPREGAGAKKLGMSFEIQGNETFGRDISGFCWDIPAAPEEFEKKKKSVFHFWPLLWANHIRNISARGGGSGITQNYLP